MITKKENLELLQLGKKRSVVNIDGVIKLAYNYNLAVVASLRGDDALSRIALTKHYETLKEEGVDHRLL